MFDMGYYTKPKSGLEQQQKQVFHFCLRQPQYIKKNILFLIHSFDPIKSLRAAAVANPKKKICVIANVFWFIGNRMETAMKKKVFEFGTNCWWDKRESLVNRTGSKIYEIIQQQFIFLDNFLRLQFLVFLSFFYAQLHKVSKCLDQFFIANDSRLLRNSRLQYLPNENWRPSGNFINFLLLFSQSLQKNILRALLLVNQNIWKGISNWPQVQYE